MCRYQGKARDSVTAQERMFRLAERDFSLSLAVIHAETKIPLNTLRGWKGGTTMPAWALGALAEAGIPEYLLSLVLTPYQRNVGKNAVDEGGTFHRAASEAQGFTSEYLEATSPDSDGGSELTHREKAKLAECAARASGMLRAVAA